MKQTLNEEQLIQIATQEREEFSRMQKVLRKVVNVEIETKTTIESLQEIQSKPSKTLFNLGSGVLVEASLKDFKKCVRSIDGKIYKNEKIEETLKKLETRRENAAKQAENIRKSLSEISARLNELEGVLRQISIEKQKRISVK